MKKSLIISAVVCFLVFSTQAQSPSNNDVRLNSKGLYTDAVGHLLNDDLEFYYMNGQVESTYEMSSGKKNGDMTVYYMNGSTKETGAFNNGLKSGEWVSYNAD